MSTYAGLERCDWCAADYYADGRCQRCGQPDEPCNEVAGRSFRMTWDMGSPHFETGAEDERYPRMPPNRAVTALRLIYVSTVEMQMLLEFMRREMATMRGYMTDYTTRVMWDGPSVIRSWPPISIRITSS